MKPEVYEIMRNGNYFLELRYEVETPMDGLPHFRVLLVGDAATKTLYDGKDEVEAIGVYKGEWAHYEAQRKASGN